MVWVSFVGIEEPRTVKIGFVPDVGEVVVFEAVGALTRFRVRSRSLVFRATQTIVMVELVKIGEGRLT